MSKFDGDYEIYSVDTSFKTLVYNFAFREKYDFKKPPKEDDKINLKFVGNKRLKVTIYKSGEIVKSKTVKGRLSNGYFTFRNAGFYLNPPFYLLLNGYGLSKSSIALSEQSDLIISTYGYGVLLLVIVPTFATSGEEHNKVFRRKNGIR
ncbi:MAG: hypothetical protein ABIP79_06365 [Chitinophagaceae bacterium]